MFRKRKQVNRKRNISRTETGDELLCSPGKNRKTLSQNNLNDGNSGSSDTDESVSSEEISDEEHITTEQKLTDQEEVKYRLSVTENDNSESDSDLESESDASENEDFAHQQENDDDDDDDDNDGEEEDVSDSGDFTEINNCVKLEQKSSNVKLSKSVLESEQSKNTNKNGDNETSSSADESSEDSSDDDDSENEEVIVDKHPEFKISSNLEHIPSKEKSDHKETSVLINKRDSEKGVPEGSSDDDDNRTDSNESDNDSDDGKYALGNYEKTEAAEDEFVALKKELANVPLEDLMKIKEKLGLKMFNKIMHGDKFEDKKQKVFKRANKNRPMEVSSKKKVPVIRHTEVAKEKVRRDPRFDDLSGEFQDKHFMKNYSFLDDVKSKEKMLVQKKMLKTKDESKKKELAKLLNRMNQQEQVDKQKRRRLELEQQWKEKEKQLVKEGKTPYFLKKSDKKKLELAEKFKELQKSGKMDQYMSKKMKKNAQKEKKKLPGRHQRFM